MSFVLDIDMKKYLLVERGSPELFRGSKEADVLFLGQDPTIVSPRHIPVALDLENSSGPISKYIFGKICKYLGFSRRRVLAWNLVNRYLVKKPRALADDPQIEPRLSEQYSQLNGNKNDWKTVRFLYHYFIEFGKQELEYVVNKYQPRILISLGEPVFRVLRYAYALPQRISMPENLAEFCCDRTFKIKIGNIALVWLALPHEPTGDRNPHYQKVLSEKLPVVASLNEIADCDPLPSLCYNFPLCMTRNIQRAFAMSMERQSGRVLRPRVTDAFRLSFMRTLSGDTSRQGIMCLMPPAATNSTVLA